MIRSGRLSGQDLRNLAGSFLGLVLLGFIAGSVIFAAPLLEKLLPAANLGYLLKDGDYLVLLQNNAELRASGGFIGSYAEMEVKNGLPLKIDLGTNIYKLDERFTEQVTIPPPAPLNVVSAGKWAFRDSNWAADFPEAALKILWFYERESALTGKQVDIDGVIAITTTVVEELLRLTGPIEMPKYTTTLTADNFAEVVQYKVDKEYFEDRTNWDKDEPKTILKDIIPILEARLKAADKKALANIILRMLDEKYIVLFSKDPLAQRLIKERNWGGAVDRTKGNYLYVVNSNIQGLKSSRKIKQRIRYDVSPATRRVTLFIEREHTGSWVWPDGENKNWVRVLVPQGSTLVEAKFGVQEYGDKVEVGSEAGKTAFGFWMNTEPQYTQDVTLVYELPKDLVLSPLTIQRQPGANPDHMTILVSGQEQFVGEVKTDQKIALSR